MAAQLRKARGLLLIPAREDNPGSRLLEDPARSWSDRVDVLKGSSHGDDAVRDVIAAHGPVLIRPDGYIAWAGDNPTGLSLALRRWFGPPRPVQALSTEDQLSSCAGRQTGAGR
jgi:hypothetical protein